MLHCIAQTPAPSEVIWKVEIQVTVVKRQTELAQNITTAKLLQTGTRNMASLISEGCEQSSELSLGCLADR